MPYLALRPFHAVFLAAALVFPAGSAFAESAVQKECSEKYQAAKAASTLNGQTYNQFYKQCAAEAKAEKTAAPAAPAVAPAPTPVAAPAKPPVAAPAKEAMPAPAAAPATVSPASAASGEAVYPSAIAPSFSAEKPGKARMKTCLEQYQKNKATNGNGGMKWIQKGGGYYSECNKRLKG